jgi:signal transduction histidine kinase
MDMSRFDGLIAIQQSIGNAKGDLNTVMDAIVREMSVMPQSNGIVVELRDGDQLYYAAASGASAPMLGLRLPLHGSLSGRSILTGHPLQCEDSETDPRVNREACRRVGLRSMIVVPIPHNGQIVGVLKYHASEPAAYSDADMLIAHLLVGPIAVGLSSVAEADAVRAQNELRAIVSMKEQLVSTVSHELRTPLTSIAGSLDLLGGGAVGQLSEQANSLVSIASRNTHRLRRLVDDLLDLDKLDAGRIAFRIAEIDMNALLSDVVAECAPFAAETGADLVLQVPEGETVLATDSDRIAQAITNLISNACKFSPPGATVTVELLRHDDGAAVRVSDEGPGVPEAFKSRLFDRFSQSDHTHGLTKLPGTGLGLSISKGIVEGLGGGIRCEDRPARGTIFEIRLPRQPARNVADNAA